MIEPEHQSVKNWIIFWSLVCHGIGLVLKIFYYTKLHDWSDLINVVHKDSENNNLNFKTEFNCHGRTIPIKVPLLPSCCVTKAKEDDHELILNEIVVI